MFFPFDPYLLRRSARFLKLPSSYNTWGGGHQHDTDTSHLSSDDELEVPEGMQGLMHVCSCKCSHELHDLHMLHLHHHICMLPSSTCMPESAECIACPVHVVGIVLTQLLIAAGAESQTDSSSEEEDAEFEPQSLQGQSMGISFQSKPLGMLITVLPSIRVSVKAFRMLACITQYILGVSVWIILPDWVALLAGITRQCRDRMTSLQQESKGLYEDSSLVSSPKLMGSFEPIPMSC